MQKRIFLIHGWDGYPENAWFPWLKKELEAKGFAVEVPDMPHPENPTINEWVSRLASVVGEADKNTYFVGHSIACQTIFRYLEKLDKPVGGVVCVAGFFNLPNLETQEERDIAKPWLETPINHAKVKEVAGNVIAIFSDDDPDVPLSDKDLFEEWLGAKTVVEHGKGHFGDDDDIKELPSALEAILTISVDNSS